MFRCYFRSVIESKLCKGEPNSIKVVLEAMQNSDQLAGSYHNSVLYAIALGQCHHLRFIVPEIRQNKNN